MTPSEHPSGREFTPVEKAEIVRLYRDEGWGFRPLILRYGCKIRSIKRVLKEQGVPYHTSYRSTEIHFTKEQKAEIFRLQKQGQPMRAIGKIMGCSYQPIRRILKEAAVPGFGRSYTKHRLASGYVHLPPTVYRAWQTRAKNEHHEWTLTVHDVEHQFAQQRGRCYYTDLPMLHSVHQKEWGERVRKQPTAMSLDRRDSKRGYTPDNIVLCCRFANLAKNSWDESIFMGVMQKAATNLAPLPCASSNLPPTFGLFSNLG